jgi:hypothetical protein
MIRKCPNGNAFPVLVLIEKLVNSQVPMWEVTPMLVTGMVGLYGLGNTSPFLGNCAR